MKGILPSLNTPFTNLGELDLDSLTRLVEHTILSGCGGMLGLAVAGEHNTLNFDEKIQFIKTCLLYTSPSPRDRTRSRMPSSA